jgi:hypothetical protein
MLPALYWAAAVTVCWFCIYRLLFVHVAPIFADGGGLLPTLGSPNPAALSFEQYRSDGIPRTWLYPYWTIASLFTLAACVSAARAVRRGNDGVLRLFFRSAAYAFFSFLVLGAVSDLGGVIHLWSRARIYQDIYELRTFLMLAAPSALLAGIAAIVGRAIVSMET